jgi:hypothetical protein
MPGIITKIGEFDSGKESASSEETEVLMASSVPAGTKNQGELI